ncbi:D-alanyl-D-alanine carboxypeptidase family protein [Cytobacillus gottheilii]|uniref:D-alanyl-D-alanine carboxypeptidase family protein n=1 Tax=Cytobacillus gottheilii TaxID=859144 RepID=UPI002494366E|nr:D-alanyl-D-alanine carboxypeptidase family protein [Cytobacillus gottheilii]
MRNITLQKDDMYKGYLLLVNSHNGLKQRQAQDSPALVPCLENVESILLERRAAASLTQLLEKVEARGKIVPVSGFRSKEEQEQLFQDSLIENGRTFTEQYVAYPGCSEHESGLAIDLGENTDEIDFIRPSFPYTGIFGQFRKLAADYGFIERYSSGKEEITGISHEPWHFRYIGYPHARIMDHHNFCLEEYIQFLSDFPQHGQHYTFSEKGKNFEIFYVRAIDQETIIQIPEDCLYQVSGNNVDGFIVTVWRNSL